MLLKPSDVVEDVYRVLARAGGAYNGPIFVTAHQILNRLPRRIRSRLIRERGRAGAGSGHYYASASIVSDAAEMLMRRRRVDIEWLDTRGLHLECGGETIQAGNASCALYRMHQRVRR